MADGLTSVCESAAFQHKISNVNLPPKCSSCLKYKREWEEVVEELETAKKIIHLLQEDLNTYKDVMPPNILDVSSSIHLNSKSSVNWETDTGTSRKSTRERHKHQHTPVIPISNRYDVLHNLQNDVESLNTRSNHQTKQFAPLKHKKTISSPNRRKKKILLIGDSHILGCASELKKYLGLDYEISGTIMPGSRLQNVTNLTRNEISGLSQSDALIIWAGCNDINRNESMKSLKYLNDFVNQTKNTNIRILTALHRHDLPITSCINNEVQNFNRKLRKFNKNKDNVGILEKEAKRENFTQHGLHLNNSGKDKIARLMAQNLTQLFEVTKKLPIISKWRTTPSDPDPINSANYAKTTVNELIVIKEGQEDLLDHINQGTRTSNRLKRKPNTRSDDFLWT